MMKRSFVTATLLLSTMAPAFAQDGAKASFDCKKAATPVEKAICDGPFLADLDRIMDEIYRGVSAKLEGPKRAALTNVQNRWLQSRNTKCGRTKPDQDCLSTLYKDRIVALARE